MHKSNIETSYNNPGFTHCDMDLFILAISILVLLIVISLYLLCWKEAFFVTAFTPFFVKDLTDHIEKSIYRKYINKVCMLFMFIYWMVELILLQFNSQSWGVAYGFRLIIFGFGETLHYA